MRLLNLIVRNWGVFRGTHSFSLKPTLQSDGARQHIVTFSGHNGAGKSTLFQAIALAFHGSLALGDRVSRQVYSDFLFSRLHRHSVKGATHVSDEASVELEFHYVRSGKPLDVRIKRHWQRIGEGVSETLTVFQDDEPPDVDPADYQTWLNGLVPPGLASICFFDAEQLDTLANPARHNGLLGDTLRRLLGLDLVEQLQSDLDYYTRRRGGGARTAHLRERVLRQQVLLDDLDGQLEQLEAKIQALASERASLEADLSKQERLLAAEGGSYAARRPLLQKELVAAQEEIERVADQLRELSAGLLPFSLAPELCQALSQRLAQEADIRRRQAAGELWQEKLVRLGAALQSEDLWQEAEASLKTRQILSKRLERLIREMEPSLASDEQSLLHHLAEPEEKQLQGWITLALDAIPQRVQSLGQRMKELEDKRQSIEEDLSRAPDDEVLAPIHAKILLIESSLSELQGQERKLNEQIGALQFQREEQARELERTAERLASAQASERQLVLAERSKLVLKSYKDALTRQRLDVLEDKLITAFNTICRKEHLLKGAYITPEDFDVQLRGVDGHVLGLSDFSAGERQLYALAILWALRRISGWQLPLIIDTPLARLDEIHRWRLVNDYLPAVSEQVVLFTTDAELDLDLMSHLKPGLARVYRLDFDPDAEETVVTLEYQADSEKGVLAEIEAPEAPLENVMTGGKEMARDA